MIARIWRGVVPEGRSDEYLQYLRETGFKEYRGAVGNLGLKVLRKTQNGRTEYTLITFWESMEAIKGFAGPDYEKAVYYPRDRDFLIDAPRHVTHYDVIEP